MLQRLNKKTSNVSVKLMNLSRRDSWSVTIVRLVLVFCSRQAPPTIRRRDRSPWKTDFWSWREAQTQKQITWKQKENRLTSVKATERARVSAGPDLAASASFRKDYFGTTVLRHQSDFTPTDDETWICSSIWLIWDCRRTFGLIFCRKI